MTKEAAAASGSTLMGGINISHVYTDRSHGRGALLQRVGGYPKLQEL